MGSECSVHKDYELEEPIDCSNSEWSLYPAHSKRSTAAVKRVTVFIHKKNKKERRHDVCGVTNSPQILKVLRHPAILKYYGSYESSEEVVMVTEPVQPLDNVLHELDVDEIVAGLQNIVQALVFLHDKGGLSHNSVGLSSVFVSNNDGSWKLGGMQCVCKPELVSNQFLDGIKPLRDIKSVTPEEKDGIVTLSAESNHSIDAYGFGMLVSDVLDSRDDIGTPGDRFGELMQNFFLNTEPKSRPRLQSLLTDEFFKNSYLEVVTFLNNITIKTDIDKDKFFSSLASKLQNISPTIVAKRLLPRLLSRFVMAEPSAEKEFLPHLLTPGTGVIQYETDNIFPVLPLDLFKEFCSPILLKLWVVKDLHIRIILLKFSPLFAKAFDVEDLEQIILPQMLVGLRDTNDGLVCATLHALANMVPVLGGHVVVGGERHRYFTEGRPKFSLGSSSQVTQEHSRETIFSYHGNSKKKSMDNPLNVSEVLNMERTSEKSTKPQVVETAKNKKCREKQKEEMETRREERRKDRELRRALRQNDTQEQSHKTLLEIAKDHEESGREDKHDDEYHSHHVTDVDNEEWEDFKMSDSPPKPDSTLPLASQERHKFPSHSSSTTKFDLSDVDFTPFQQQGTSCDSSTSDLICWDNWEKIRSKTPPGTGKAMKLGDKKINARTYKPQLNSKEDLGKIYEIPDITATIKEPDFFSDMQPKVEFKSYDGGIGGSNAMTPYSRIMDVNTTVQVGADWDVEDWATFD